MIKGQSDHLYGACSVRPIAMKVNASPCWALADPEGDLRLYAPSTLDLSELSIQSIEQSRGRIAQKLVKLLITNT